MAFAWREQNQMFVRRFELFDSRFRINLDRREGIVMKSKDLVATDEFGSSERILHIHGEVVSDAQRGKFELGRIADEFHIHRQGGVTRVVKVAFAALDDKAARIAAVSSI